MTLPLAPIASLAVALFVALAVRVLAPGAPRLRDRLRPYLVPATSELEPRRAWGRSPRQMLAAAGRILEGSSDAALSRKIRQAGVLAGVPAAQRVTVYRTRVVLTTVAGASSAIVLGLMLDRSAQIVLGFAALGGAAGAAYWRGRLDRAIEHRRAAMRIELYTINQLLAIHLRVGSGVVASVRRLAARGQGEVVDELRDALVLHRRGFPAAEAFRRIAEATPEPHARRTYAALASADERGTDVARALLALSEDVREGRRDAIRRRATRSRALMLVPILGLLAPVLILFVAAPIPWLVLHGIG